jgi:hypothetical protein
MFPPSSPLIERVRVQNEKKQLEQRAAAHKPGLLKSLNFLSGKSQDNARPAFSRAELCAVENV